MKNVKIITTSALLLLSFSGYAHSISVTADTLDDAEAKIATQAAEQGADYVITEANTNNRVHMTAELYK
ncbi:YdgH/BhsA/McbA-like domain-containing protein [Klebsiella pneumoniae]|uniref:DUF1471 domain-containing protein n=1 Tax=Klebsiella pneumoniae TaxID=573 RepID=UPI003B2541B0